MYHYFTTTNTNHLFTENNHSCETKVQHRANVPPRANFYPHFDLTFPLGCLLLLLTYPFSSVANHSVMTKRALWLSRKRPTCLTSQCSALASWLMALLGKRARAAQPCANWTYRRRFPTDSRWNVFWGGFLHVFQSSRRMFLLDVSFPCVLHVLDFSRRWMFDFSIAEFLLATLLTIQFYVDLRFVFWLNFTGVLTDINTLRCTSSEGRSRCNACWELDSLTLLEKEMTPVLWISLLTNKLADVYANLLLVMNDALLNMNTKQDFAFNATAQFWSGHASC